MPWMTVEARYRRRVKTKNRNEIQKKCSKCGKSVINLSRHQKDVHGMKKLKRKLHDYLSGEKKKPKGMVKFCPLSPCKGKKTPIFQLNKHLQTPLHGLKPDTPSYREALKEAPRVSLDFIDDHLKKQKKGGKLRNSKRGEQRGVVTMKSMKVIMTAESIGDRVKRTAENV